MSSYLLRDDGFIEYLMEDHQAQFYAWTTHFNEMEKNITLLNE